MKKAWAGIAVFAAMSFASVASAQQAGGIAVEVPQVRNYIALGLASVPDYTGSDDYTAAIGPAGLLRFDSSERYVRLLATELSVNLLNSRNFSLGPMLNYRIGRTDDVEDEVVARMREIDDSLEAGGFVGWRWMSAQDPRHQVSLQLQGVFDVSGGHDGFLTSASARYFVPVARWLIVSLGTAATYASENYTQTYFGVDPDNAARSGLPLFRAGGGMRDVRISPMALVSFSPKWHLSAGVIFSQLVGDAADSPVVDTRGDSSQWMAGIGIVYAW